MKLSIRIAFPRPQDIITIPPFTPFPLHRICGYPPFHTDGGAPMSPGMKKRIRQGDYTFPDPEWSNVSSSGIHWFTLVLKLSNIWISSFSLVPFQHTRHIFIEFLKQTRQSVPGSARKCSHISKITPKLVVDLLQVTLP